MRANNPKRSPGKWSDQAFVARVKERVGELGLTMKQALGSAGVSHDTLDKNPRSGRNLDTLIRLAEALDWELSEIMGLAPARVSPEKLKLAFAIARDSLRKIDHGEDAVIELTARIYNHLLELERDGIAIDDRLTKSLALYIASEWRKKE